LKRLKESDLLLLGGPRMPFNTQELNDIRKYIEEGGKVMLLMHEGGENKLGTNINVLLE
jgi:intraflagellar transport protein 52